MFGTAILALLDDFGEFSKRMGVLDSRYGLPLRPASVRNLNLAGHEC